MNDYMVPGQMSIDDLYDGDDPCDERPRDELGNLLAGFPDEEGEGRHVAHEPR